MSLRDKLANWNWKTGETDSVHYIRMRYEGARLALEEARGRVRAGHPEDSLSEIEELLKELES